MLHGVLSPSGTTPANAADHAAACPLKVWAGFRRGGSATYWRLPARFTWVPALALSHLCVPEASFPMHLSGVLAGLARAYVVEPGAARPRHCCKSCRCAACQMLVVMQALRHA